MVDRFRDSGREKLVVIVASDFDPEGEDIPGSFGISLRDDFGTEAGRGAVQEKAFLREIIEKLNTLFGSDTTEGTSCRTRRLWRRRRWNRRR
ncbi:MAG: hypothetical protein KF774_21140 [Planctomyces sp.]|nr:hypothetical protein [Planctomyces sp.]